MISYYKREERLEHKRKREAVRLVRRLDIDNPRTQEPRPELLKLIDSQMAVLRRQREHLESLEDAERARAAVAAIGPDGPSATLNLRYQSMHHSYLRNSLRDLATRQAQRPEDVADEPAGEPPVETGFEPAREEPAHPAASEPFPAIFPAPTEPKRVETVDAETIPAPTEPRRVETVDAETIPAPTEPKRVETVDAETIPAPTEPKRADLPEARPTPAPTEPKAEADPRPEGRPETAAAAEADAPSIRQHGGFAPLRPETPGAMARAMEPGPTTTMMASQ